MTIQAQSADGKIHEFPDDTPQENIDRAMKDYASTTAQTTPPAEAGPSETSRVLSTINEKYIAAGLGLPVDAARWALEFVGAPVKSAEEQFGGSASIRRAMRYLGMSREGAEPETIPGKIAASTVGAATESALTGFGIGSTLERIGAAIGKKGIEEVGKRFAEPVGSVIAGAGSGVGGEVVEEIGGPRILGELAGGAATGFVPKTGLRPPGGKPADPVLDAYERLGLAPSAAEAGLGGMFARWLQGNVLAQTIGGGNVMERFRLQRLRELSDIQERIAQGYGAPLTREQAGQQVTEQVLERWTNAKKDAGKSIGDIIQPFEKDVIYAQNLVSASANPVGGASTRAVREATIDPNVKQAADMVTGNAGNFTIDDLRALQKKYGNLLEPGFVKNVNDAQIQQLWQAVTKDIEEHVKTQSPQQYAALKAANAEYKGAMDDFRQNFRRILGTQEKPVHGEKAYELLVATGSSKARADLDLFRNVWDTLNPKARGELAATVLTRMGAIDKNAPLTTENFEIGRFLREYRDLTPQAKDMLFRSTGNAKLASALDDLVAVNTRIQDKISRLVSTSRSGAGIMAMLQGGSILHGAASLVAHGDPTTLAVSAGGPFVAAHFLTNPKAVRGWIKAQEPIERMLDAIARAAPTMDAIQMLQSKQTGGDQRVHLDPQDPRFDWQSPDYSARAVEEAQGYPRIENVGGTFNPDAFAAGIESRPASTNIEDRR